MTTIQRAQFLAAVLSLFPLIPAKVATAVADREARRARNRTLQDISYTPLALASVTGYIRHHLTEYDHLLAQGNIAQDRIRQRMGCVNLIGKPVQ